MEERSDDEEEEDGVEVLLCVDSEDKDDNALLIS
jgi:hypothetical protein